MMARKDAEMSAKLENILKAGFKTDPNTTRGNGQREWIFDLMVGATQYIIPVNDGDTVADWTESDNGTLDVTADTNNVRVNENTNHMRVETTAATDGTQYVETRLIKHSALPTTKLAGDGQAFDDWRDTDFIATWMAAYTSADFNTAGEALLGIVYLDTDLKEQVTTFSLPAMVGASDSDAIKQLVDVDISSMGENRKHVVALRYYANNAATGQGFTVEGIHRYRFSTGNGAAYGRCIKVPITGSNVLVRGDIVQLDAATLGGIGVSVEAAAAVNTYGVVIEGGTGAGDGSVYATVQHDGPAYLRGNAATVLGELIIWQSDHATHGHLVQGGATGVDENAFAKGMEACAGQFSDFLCHLTHTATFIS